MFFGTWQINPPQINPPQINPPQINPPQINPPMQMDASTRLSQLTRVPLG
jgi:hypothetical protein